MCLFVNAGVRFKSQATRAEREAQGHGLGRGPAPGQGLGPASGQGPGHGLDEETMAMVDDFCDVAMAAEAMGASSGGGGGSSSSSSGGGSSSSSGGGGTNQATCEATPQNTTNVPSQPSPTQSSQRSPQSQPSQSSHWLVGPSATASSSPPHPIIPDHFSCPPSSRSSPSRSRQLLQLQWERKRELGATNERIHLMEVTPPPSIPLPFFRPPPHRS